MKLNGFKKNLIIMICIVVLVYVVFEVLRIVMSFLFPILVVIVALWLLISPFRINDHE